jgi:CubicO group peptidase (beta-lactamase class C family)
VSSLSGKWQEYTSFVEEIMAREHIAGAAVAVAERGQVIFERGFGYRDLEQQLPVTPDTIFGVASVSKSFTAMAIMQLVDAGLVDVDDPVSKYLPEFKLNGVDDISAIKVRHLLSHTTGLPPMRRRQDIQTFDEHIRFLQSEEYSLLGQPGEYFSYCNDTFLLLGMIIERLTGRIYRKYMTEHILNALGMYRSTYSIEELTRFQDVTVPYLYDEKAEQWQAQPWPALGNFEVGGGVRSTVRDLLKYGEAYVNGGQCPGQQIASAQSLAAMRQPMYRTGRKTWYCFALQVTPDHQGYTLVEHGGSQPGVAASFGFVPEKGIVVAVLTNTSGVSASALWLGAVNTALGLPLDLARSVEPEYQPSAAEIQSVLGHYRAAEGGQMWVTEENGRLQVADQEHAYPARMSGPDTLVYTMKIPRVVRFYFREGETQAWAALAGMRMLQRVK